MEKLPWTVSTFHFHPDFQDLPGDSKEHVRDKEAWLKLCMVWAWTLGLNCRGPDWSMKRERAIYLNSKLNAFQWPWSKTAFALNAQFLFTGEHAWACVSFIVGYAIVQCGAEFGKTSSFFTSSLLNHVRVLCIRYVLTYTRDPHDKEEWDVYFSRSEWHSSDPICIL